MNSKEEFGNEVAAIGTMVGLLVGTADDLTVNTKWFKNPIAPDSPSLANIGTRLDRLVTLLHSLLGPGVANPLNGFADAQWYAIPNPNTDAGTPFHIVAPRGAVSEGELGFGVRHAMQIGNLTFAVYAYIPLFSYSPSGVEFLTDSPQHPCQIGLRITTVDGAVFKTDGVSFTAMTVDTSIYLEPTAYQADPAPRLFTLVFKNLQGTSQSHSYDTLDSLLDSDVESWIGEVLVQGSSWLDVPIGDYWASVGEILTAASFLTRDDQGQYHLNLKDLRDRSAADIALNAVFGVLTALSESDIPIAVVVLPGGGLYVVSRDNADGATDYGLRLAVDISLTAGQSTNGKAPPAIDLSLGTWLTGEDDTTNWIQRSMGPSSHTVPDVGLSIFALRYDRNFDISFAPSFALSSVGINIKGGGDAPLLNLNGYTLRGGELRTYLDSHDWSYGFAVRLDDVGFPLGTSFDQAQQGGDTTNPVAKTLLASGPSQGGTNGMSAVNPAFSVTAGYISGCGPVLEIYDAQGTETDIIWFPIQRRLGPLNCQKVGLKIAVTGTHKTDPVLGLVFDGGVSLAALDVYLNQLSIGVHLKEAGNIDGYELGLEGLDITFSGGGVEISGGLLKTKDSSGAISYDGEAIIKFGTLALVALGSYGSLPNHGGTSMFIFAMLNGPLGGPACFYVTGLAAGFGYNRGLKIPAQNEVRNFPLIAGLANPTLIGGATPSPTQALSSLETWVPPERGEYWLAAGLQFTTFEIINTNALLIVEFGRDFVIAVVGIATLKQPLIGDPYVYAELDIEVVVEPAQGDVRASAVLAPSSYVLTPQAHLTGGFAFFAWFGTNAHAGDFVFTLGGYHPAFKVPSHYPQESRVGINWKVNNSIALVGGVYFAITPTAMMAGGGLQLTFAAGSLQAWFKAQIDIILFWKPFYLIADASITVGVSYRIDALFVHTTLSVELSADFHLWAPPIGGSAHVNWYIISFSFTFGAEKRQNLMLSWEDFKGLLPSKTQQHTAAAPQAPHLQARHAATVSDPSTSTAPVYLHITVNEGLQSTRTQDGMTLWLVRAGHFQFSVGSALAASAIVVESQDANDNRTLTGSPVGLRQVNGGIPPQDYQSTQTLAILQLAKDDLADIQTCMATTNPCSTQPTGCTGRPLDLRGWEIDAVTQNLPQAMWGTPIACGQSTNINPDTPTVTGTVGVTMYPQPAAVTNYTPAMVIDEVFADRTVNPTDTYRLPLSQTLSSYNITPQKAATFADLAGVNDSMVVQKRSALFAALQGFGINGWTNDPLPRMAVSPGRDFADEPMAGTSVAALA